jgi:hypothetical protein
MTICSLVNESCPFGIAGIECFGRDGPNYSHSFAAKHFAAHHAAVAMRPISAYERDKSLMEWVCDMVLGPEVAAVTVMWL